jgi:hypothetical protein
MERKGGGKNEKERKNYFTHNRRFAAVALLP